MEFKDFMKENQQILEQWQKPYEDENGECPNFSWDGIMFKGKFYREECSGNLLRQESKNGTIENDLWANAPIRILFLTKDQNTNGGVAWDSRKSTFRSKNYEEDDYVLSRFAFNKRIAWLVYGLGNTTSSKMINFQEIESSDNDEKVLKFIDSFPFAQINCKKEGGGASCPPEVLKQAMEKDGIYLEKQIQNIDPDIFVCCGSTENGYHADKKNYALRFLNTHGYRFEYLGNKYIDIYYDSEKNKIAIDSYHPVYTERLNGVDDEEFYNESVENYYHFLLDYPDFQKSHRK